MQYRFLKLLSLVWFRGLDAVYACVRALANEALAWLPQRRDHRIRLFKGFAALSVLSVVAVSFATSQRGVSVGLDPIVLVAEHLELIIKPEQIMRAAPLVLEERVRRGDSLGSLASRLSINDPDFLQFIRKEPQAKEVLQLRPGTLVSALTDVDGRVKWFRYWGRQDQNAEQLPVLTVSRHVDHFVVGHEMLKLEKQVEVRSGEIKSSLYSATDAANLPDGVASQLVDIFSANIDFHRDLRAGDRFRVAYETYLINGESLRPGRIVAAEFTNAGEVHSAYWFSSNTPSTGGYYNADGRSLKQSFLRSPIEFSRVSSGFTQARFHPVLQEWRAHRGVDYAAPIGTKVRATADAVVEFAGVQNGYGNVVILRHFGKFSTLYGHLDGFSPNVKKGVRVEQGDVIGFVGQTGWASGPHLHYEFRINDVQQNPLTVVLPGAPPLDGVLLAHFKRQKADLNAQLHNPSAARLAKFD
jgi:murein DD-endopeptidase MepM/ murein hydrolase activator NlpD